MYEVTPDDSNALPYGGARAVRINVGGALRFLSVFGETETVTVYDGETIHCGILQIFATGTTATGIRAYV
ncbi:MAG: hypothetical protein ROR55_20095 [Devosia sp.]